jgi:hypothetical protein
MQQQSERRVSEDLSRRQASAWADPLERGGIRFRSWAALGAVVTSSMITGVVKGSRSSE